LTAGVWFAQISADDVERCAADDRQSSCCCSSTEKILLRRPLALAARAEVFAAHRLGTRGLSSDDIVDLMLERGERKPS